MQIRTPSWPLVFRVRPRSRLSRGDRLRAATPSARAATTAKATSTASVCSGLSPDNSSATARIGPNSPTAPAERMNVPSRVSRSPESRRMGSTVPSAVVVKISPISTPAETPSSGRATVTSTIPAPRPITSDPHQPATADRNGGPAKRASSIS